MLHRPKPKWLCRAGREGVQELHLYLVVAVTLAIDLAAVSPWLQDCSLAVAHSSRVAYWAEATALLESMPQTGKVSLAVAAVLDAAADKL